MGTLYDSSIRVAATADPPRLQMDCSLALTRIRRTDDMRTRRAS